MPVANDGRLSRISSSILHARNWIVANRVLLLLLAISWSFRIALAMRGGQGYWPDEGRFNRSFFFAQRLVNRDLTGTVDYILDSPDHVGFVFVGIIPTFAQVGRTLWVSAAVLSLMSVASIALTYAVASRVGAGRSEALLAALLMACATTMFYYSRHLLPYDSSMAILLMALWLALAPHPSVKSRSVCAMFASMGFLTYNGYWQSAGLILAVSVFWRARSLSDVVRRGTLASLVFLAPPAILTGVSLIRHHKPYIVGMLEFSKSTGFQCDMREGWSLPWVHLWHAEHGLLVLWLVAVAFLVWAAAKGDPGARGRGMLWLGMVAGIWGIIVLLSCGLGKCGTMGRHGRQMVPFLCLAAACGAVCLLSRVRPRRIWYFVGAALLGGQTLVNFLPPLEQRFPNDLVREVNATWKDVRYDVTVRGPGLAYPPPANVAPRYVLLNAQSLYPVEGSKDALSGQVILRHPHPLEYLPYQYEGYVPSERSRLRAIDISMRLVDTKGDGT